MTRISMEKWGGCTSPRGETCSPLAKIRGNPRHTRDRAKEMWFSGETSAHRLSLADRQHAAPGRSALAGACCIDDVDTRLQRAFATTLADLLAATAVDRHAGELRIYVERSMDLFDPPTIPPKER